MRRWITLAAALLTLLAACGDDDAGEGTTATPAIATTTAGSTGPEGTAEAPPGPQAVTFPTADGLTLEGTLYAAGSTWVLLAHMRPADMTSWFDFALAAQQAGYTALAYNNRGYGASDAGGPLDVGADALAAFAMPAPAERRPSSSSGPR
jgi:pimeloyl-ACP methyl ester carboxylesterase